MTDDSPQSIGAIDTPDGGGLVLPDSMLAELRAAFVAASNALWDQRRAVTAYAEREKRLDQLIVAIDGRTSAAVQREATPVPPSMTHVGGEVGADGVDRRQFEARGTAATPTDTPDQLGLKADAPTEVGAAPLRRWPSALGLTELTIDPTVSTDPGAFLQLLWGKERQAVGMAVSAAQCREIAADLLRRAAVLDGDYRTVPDPATHRDLLDAAEALASMVASDTETRQFIEERYPGLAHGIDRVTRFAEEGDGATQFKRTAPDLNSTPENASPPEPEVRARLLQIGAIAAGEALRMAAQRLRDEEHHVSGRMVDGYADQIDPPNAGSTP